MAGMFFGIFIILIINQRSLSYSNDGEISHGNVENLYDRVDELYNDEEHEHNNAILENNITQKFKQMLREDLEKLSKQLMNFDTVNNENDMSVPSKSDVNSQNIINELVQTINDIEYWFDKAVELKLNVGYSNEILKNFVTSVLWDENNLKSSSNEIFTVLSLGGDENMEENYLPLMFKNIQESSYNFCDDFISEQQMIYYHFMNFIRTQLRAFATISRAYFIASAMDQADFVTEYTMFKHTFDEKLSSFMKDSIRFMNTLPANIHRCNIENPIIDENVLEMEGLFQVLVNYEALIKKAVTHRNSFVKGGCEDISNDDHLKFTVYNCKSYDSISGCPTFKLPSKPRTIHFSWFTAGSENFGHSQTCNNSLLEINHYLSTDLYYNDVCVCSVNYTNESNFPDYPDAIKIDEPKVMKISLEPQLSDIKNNMIVVGVKFIRRNDAIHLQIQQSKISRGESTVSDAVWKPVDIDNNRIVNITYGVLFDKRSIIYLDDVLAHPDYIVTGVKFQVTEDGSGFELHVHATEYDYVTGRLGEEQQWYKPGDYPINHSDYQRQRIEIKLNDPDDSTMSRYYHSDLGSNKFIQFQHSSIKKDAGYHTVPFFDAEPVKVNSIFPLSGIGLFHRGLDGFGGYIAPRLHTYNMSRIIEASSNDNLNLNEISLVQIH